ncbi:late competence development ComFB family protein [Paenibacillus aurantius]|uniref:Late competence development ComFB family protein n=1 Tax=Paenibacillus aurantius TaxID=2918900 RepID=A0AA96LJY2_9BACL|nr:late competence development ComFB family protein [Paenibacillus aurantius]WNQ13501.1 late competence development ComFB family protein [Paenibacillus aurantius]
MEELVKNCLKEMLASDPRYSSCGEKCQSDAMAIVLNRIPPKYVSTPKGEIYSKTRLGKQLETDILRELAEALEKAMDPSRASIFDRGET